MPIICKAAAISVVPNGQKLTKLYQHMSKLDQCGPKLTEIGRFQLSEGKLGVQGPDDVWGGQGGAAAKVITSMIQLATM